jgi:beta-N-acetylhexosaminidase
VPIPPTNNAPASARGRGAGGRWCPGERLKDYGTTQNRTLLAAQAGMDLILAAARNVTQGQQARGELAAAYSKGTLNRQAFLASVNRVIALRRALK